MITTTTAATTPTNKLTNGTFASNLSGWNYNVNAGAAATFNVVNGVAVAAITNVGTNNYNVQLPQANKMTTGKKYKVEFDARSSEGTSRTIGANIEKSASPYTNYGSSTYTLTTSAAHYTYTFAAVALRIAALGWYFNSANTNDVSIDNVTLIEL